MEAFCAVLQDYLKGLRPRAGQQAKQGKAGEAARRPSAEDGGQGVGPPGSILRAAEGAD